MVVLIFRDNDVADEIRSKLEFVSRSVLAFKSQMLSNMAAYLVWRAATHKLSPKWCL